MAAVDVLDLDDGGEGGLGDGVAEARLDAIHRLAYRPAAGRHQPSGVRARGLCSTLYPPTAAPRRPSIYKSHSKSAADGT